MTGAMQRYRTWLADSSRWDGFQFRPGDIVISTPANCGTTWMQMICALLIFGDARLPGPLTKLSPWLDLATSPVSEVLATLDAQRHRRFIKTHTPLDGLPLDARATYICVGRDPRDAAISADNHLIAMDREVLIKALHISSPRIPRPPRPAKPADRLERFWRWVEHSAPPESGLELQLRHLTTFWDRLQASNIVLIHYSDLRADLEGEMRRLAGRLDITINTDSWVRLVAEARFDRMRERADEVVPEVTIDGLWPDARRFFNRGASGQWRSLLGPAELRRYEARVRQLAAPDLAFWIHKGSRAGASAFLPGPSAR
ncbi:MAG TPA: sulfotransferase domain-containing protein [Streptosporangiaceae bacterium]|nr:sulfotransferase domain-containing protein [Streptosporangiaceae bacterium]